ncbi:hypothetical protein Tco_1138967 [Tanacetum coccineum]
MLDQLSIYSKEHARVEWNSSITSKNVINLSLIDLTGRQVVHANYFINNDLEYLKGGSLSRKYTTSTTKTKAAKESLTRVQNDNGSIDTEATGSPSMMYLEEIEFRREDQQLYKFREGDFPRLNLRDIEDMLLLLVQKKLSNLERDVIYDLNVALRMFTRRVVILKRVEDLQLGVKSYQKKLNITKPETFRSDITNMTPYTAYNNPQGIIYQEKFKRNRFCDGTLTFVRRVLHDIASSLEMDYLPKRRWSKLDRKRSCIMIKAIDQQLFERRVMRNLEKFVGRREYEKTSGCLNVVLFFKVLDVLSIPMVTFLLLIHDYFIFGHVFNLFFHIFQIIIGLGAGWLGPK